MFSPFSENKHSIALKQSPPRSGWKESKRTNVSFLRCILGVKFPPFLLIGLRSVEKNQITGTRTRSSFWSVRDLGSYLVCGARPCHLLMHQGLLFTCLQVQNYSEHCRFLEKRLSGLHK